MKSPLAALIPLLASPAIALAARSRGGGHGGGSSSSSDALGALIALWVIGVLVVAFKFGWKGLQDLPNHGLRESWGFFVVFLVLFGYVLAITAAGMFSGVLAALVVSGIGVFLFFQWLS